MRSHHGHAPARGRPRADGMEPHARSRQAVRVERRHRRGIAGEAGAGAAFAMTMLATPRRLNDVVFGEHGLATAAHPGPGIHRHVDRWTRTIRSIAGRFPKGVAVVDAPVRAASARPPRAASRSSSAPATRTSSACGRSSRRLVRWYTSAAGRRLRPETWSQPGTRNVDRRGRRGAGAG